MVTYTPTYLQGGSLPDVGKINCTKITLATGLIYTLSRCLIKFCTDYRITWMSNFHQYMYLHQYIPGESYDDIPLPYCKAKNDRIEWKFRRKPPKIEKEIYFLFYLCIYWFSCSARTARRMEKCTIFFSFILCIYTK